MALIELAKVIADDPAASRRWAAEPLPPSDRLNRRHHRPVRRAARTGAGGAAAGRGGRRPGPGRGGRPQRRPDARALAPAERLGLVKVDRTGLQFSHPLVRSAIYHSAPFAQRAAAHRQLAETLHDQPDRRAWHLAAAALNPDEQVASLLEATAAQAQHRGGAAAAALALERAAELSPDPADQARRLVAAASAAISTGQADWVQDLATRALAVTADPELRLTARRDAGWALAYSGRRPPPWPRSSRSPKRHRVTCRASPGTPSRMQRPSPTTQARPPAARPSAASSNSWKIAGRRRPGRGPRVDVGARGLWIRACTDPFGSRSQLVPYLRRIARSALDEPALWRAGSAAWLLDESGLAIQMLQDAMHRLQAPGMRGTSGPGLTALGWAYMDTGRWDEALEAAAEAAAWLRRTRWKSLPRPLT